MDNQAVWAAMLKKSVHQNRQRVGMSLDEQWAELKVKIRKSRTELIATASAGLIDETRKIFTKLVDLRARQAGLEYNFLKIKTNQKPATAQVETIVKNYQADCLQLAVNTDTLLGIKYKL